MHRATSRVLFPLALSRSYTDDHLLGGEEKIDKKDITIGAPQDSDFPSSSFNCTELSELSPSTVSSNRTPMMNRSRTVTNTPASAKRHQAYMMDIINASSPQPVTSLTPKVGSFFGECEFGISSSPSTLYSNHSGSCAATPDPSHLEVNFLDTFSKTVWQQVGKQRRQQEYYALADAELQRQLAKVHAVENIASLLQSGELLTDEEDNMGDTRPLGHRHNGAIDGDATVENGFMSSTSRSPSSPPTLNTNTVVPSFYSNGNFNGLPRVDTCTIIDKGSPNGITISTPVTETEIGTPARNKRRDAIRSVAKTGDISTHCSTRSRRGMSPVSQALHSSGPSKKELHKVPKLSRADVTRALEMNDKLRPKNESASHRLVQNGEGLSSGSDGSGSDTLPTLECLADPRVVTFLSNEQRLRAQAVKKCAEDLFKCLKGVPASVSRQILDTGITDDVIEKYVQRIRSSRRERSQRAFITKQVKRLKVLQSTISRKGLADINSFISNDVGGKSSDSIKKKKAVTSKRINKNESSVGPKKNVNASLHQSLKTENINDELFVDGHDMNLLLQQELQVSKHPNHEATVSLTDGELMELREEQQRVIRRLKILRTKNAALVNELNALTLNDMFLQELMTTAHKGGERTHRA